MKSLAPLATIALVMAALAGPAQAQSFSCMETYRLNATEQRVCKSRWLSSLDERLAFWYGRALVRAGYFEQTGEVKSAQKAWLRSRNQCGSGLWCIQSHYLRRIRELKNYAEHV